MGGFKNSIITSQILNWFTDIWEQGMADTLWDWVGNIFGTIIWLFCEIFFWILDIFEVVFKAFAGIGTGVTGSLDGKTEKIEGDLVLYFIQSNLVQDIFISIVILSVILLIIFTIFAIVKNQYAEKQEPVKKIIGNSFKGLWLYLVIPVATVVCLLVGNIVLQAIDGATKMADTASSSDMLFTTATYNANRLRGEEAEDELHDMLVFERLSYETITKMNNACPGLNIDDEADTFNAESADWELLAQIIDNDFAAENIAGIGQSADKWSFWTVNNYYYALKISYITIWIGGAFLIWAIGKISWGMVSRLFKMVLYFAISPAVVATYPIKGDGPLKSWTGEMVKSGTSAYCAVGVLNVLYSILPFISDIDFGLLGQFGTLIVRLFIYIIAFSSAQNLIGTVSGWFGTGDAIKEGKDAKGQVTKGFETAKKSLEKPGAFVGKAAGFTNAVISGGKRAKDMNGNWFGGAIQGAYSQTSFAQNMQKQRDAWKKAGEAGSSQYDKYRTTNFWGGEDKIKKAAYEDIETAEKLRTAWKASTGDDWDGGIDETDRARLGTLRTTDPAAYRAMIRRSKQINKADETGAKIYFREKEQLEKQEADHKRDAAYNTRFAEAQRLRGLEEEKATAFDSRVTRLLGGTSLSSLGLSDNEQNQILEAILAGDGNELLQIGIAAENSGNTTVKNAIDSAIGNMTDRVVEGLNTLKDAYDDAASETTQAVERLNSDMVEDKELQKFATQSGYTTDGKVDISNVGSHLSGVSSNLERVAETLSRAADGLEVKMAAATSRHMSGTMTAADRSALKDYNDAHPSSK